MVKLNLLITASIWIDVAVNVTLESLQNISDSVVLELIILSHIS